MKKKKHSKKQMMIPLVVVTTVGVVGVCSSKKVKAMMKKHHERCVVKHFVQDYISESSEMKEKINRLSEKQIDFLYRLINKLGDIKAGVRLTGETLEETRQKIIDDVNEFISAHARV